MVHDGDLAALRLYARREVTVPADASAAKVKEALDAIGEPHKHAHTCIPSATLPKCFDPSNLRGSFSE